MRKPLSVLVHALVPAACTLLLAGCGCGGAIDASPVALKPSSVTALRTSASCVVAEPPYDAEDAFTLTIVGSTSGPAPYNTLTLRIRDTASSTTGVPLTVPLGDARTKPATVQTAESTDSNITFSFARGSNASEVDATFLSSVLVTVVSVPTADGQNLSATLDVIFTDGDWLEATYTAPVTSTDPTPCHSTGLLRR